MHVEYLPLTHAVRRKFLPLATGTSIVVLSTCSYPFYTLLTSTTTTTVYTKPRYAVR